MASNCKQGHTDRLVWLCQIHLERIFSQHRSSWGFSDLLKTYWKHADISLPGQPYSCTTGTDTSTNRNIREGSAASWPVSGGPTHYSRKMQEKGSFSSLKREKNSKFMMIHPGTSSDISFPFFFSHHFTDLLSLVSVETPKFLLIHPNIENAWFLASCLGTEWPCPGPPCWTTQLPGGSF